MRIRQLIARYQASSQLSGCTGSPSGRLILAVTLLLIQMIFAAIAVEPVVAQTSLPDSPSTPTKPPSTRDVQMRVAIPPEFRTPASAHTDDPLSRELAMPDQSTESAEDSWQILLIDSFDYPSQAAFGEAWFLYQFDENPLDIDWGITNYDAALPIGLSESIDPQIGKSTLITQSVWIAAGGADAVNPADGAPDNIDTWMMSQPIDLSNMRDAGLWFSTRYNIEVGYDNLGVCVGLPEEPGSETILFYYEDCNWLAGSSEGWYLEYSPLLPFIGEPEVFVAWSYYADESNLEFYDGAFIDDVSIWGLPVDASDPTYSYEDVGLLLANGDFNQVDSADWLFTPAADDEGEFSLTPLTQDDFVATLRGSGVLSQRITVPEDTIALGLELFHSMASTELQVGDDVLCVAIAEPGKADEFLADFGCFDPLTIPQTVREENVVFDRFRYSLTPNQVLTLSQFEEVDFVIQALSNTTGNGKGETTFFIDDVILYAVGGENQGSSLDMNEWNGWYYDPVVNEWKDVATPISCDATVSGVIGDLLVTSDIDLFQLEVTTGGVLQLNIDANSLRPKSSLDSVLSVYGTDWSFVALNDDEDASTGSLDSRIVITDVEVGRQLYIVVESYDGTVDPDYRYDLSVACGESSGGSSQNSDPPPAQNPAGEPKAWTLAYYINAEQKVEESDEQLRSEYAAEVLDNLRRSIGGKEDIVHVVALVDGPGEDDTFRYALQTDGLHATKVREANMGSSEELRAFLDWAFTRYPSTHTYVAIDGQGQGIVGMNWDGHNGNGDKIFDYLTVQELRQALNHATRQGQRKIDVLDLQAPLLGLFENAYELKDLVNYLVFFQSLLWPDPDAYGRVLSGITSTETPSALGERVVHSSQSVLPYSRSLIETSRLDALLTAFSQLADALLAQDKAELRRILSDARDLTQAYNGAFAKGDSTQDIYGYLDIGSFVDKVEQIGGYQTYVNAVKKAITETVRTVKLVPVGSIDGAVWDYRDGHGLSFFFPQLPLESIEFYCRNYRASESGRWDDVLTTVVFDRIWECNTDRASAMRQVRATQSNFSNQLMLRPISIRGIDVILGMRPFNPSTLLEDHVFVVQTTNPIFLPMITR